MFSRYFEYMDKGLMVYLEGFIKSELFLAFILLILAVVSYSLSRFIILNIARRIARKTKTDIDDIFIQKKVFEALSLLVPAVIIHFSLFAFHRFAPVLVKIEGIILTLSFTLLATRLLQVGLILYERLPIASRWPLRGYIQIVKILAYSAAGIVIICIILGKSPWGILSGLGAMSAILMLVFRHAILSFIASFQVIAQDLIRIGDWIEMPKYGVDGEVIDITLSNLIVRNWDKTIVAVPTYKLLEESFKNWRGMEIEGARRIKRAIYIDQHTVKFCDDEMIERFKRVHLIKDYIERKVKEIEEYNRAHGIDTTASPINGRKLTNLGVFRIYIEEYLKQHPQIRKDLTLMVRHLSPTPQGIPLEVYAFAADTRWVNYERIQADIFDHILAAIAEFDLRVFQYPSGADLKEGIKLLR